MLRFERDVVATLVPGLEGEVRTGVEAYVDGALRDLPEHIRAGVLAESLLLGAWTRAQRVLGRTPADVLGGGLERLDGSPVGPVRQYARLFRSLVTFSEEELSPEPST